MHADRTAALPSAGPLSGGSAVGASTRAAIVAQLRESLAGLLAVYAFGSRVQGHADGDSDLDLAVLVAGYAEPLALWELAGGFSDWIGCEAELLDLRAASTVMQHQVLTTGERWWAADVQAGIYEAFILSEKTALDEARAGLLADIARDGYVHAR